MLPRYLRDVEERSASLMLDATINAIDTSTFSAGVSDDDDSDGSDEDENGGDDAESVVESNDSGDSDDDDNVQ
jgi:hypothetical protein